MTQILMDLREFCEVFCNFPLIEFVMKRRSTDVVTINMKFSFLRKTRNACTAVRIIYFLRKFYVCNMESLDIKTNFIQRFV